MRIVTSKMPGTHSVTISAFVLVGSRYETLELSGISHFIEHLVFKGTERRPTPEKISSVIEGVGGEINAGTEQELTVYWCKVPGDHLPESLDLVLDMLRNSIYAEEELEREKGVILEEQSMINDYPHQKVEMMLDNLLWPNHPLGRDISGTPESVTSLTRNMVLDYVQHFYTPANVVLSVAGDIDHDGVVEQVEGICAGWESRPAPNWIPFTTDQSDSQVCIEYRNTGQSNIAIGFPGLSYTHPQRHALDLLSIILGEGMSSRLFLEIREKQGLAYDVFSTTSHFLDCGAFIIAAGVDPKKVYVTTSTLMNEIGRLADGITEDELARAKIMSAGRLLLSLEGTRAISSWIGGQEALLGQISDVATVTQAINAVSLEDIFQIATDLLRTDRLNLAVVGPHRGKARFQKEMRLH
jgi:predicted Zn-dependent peptidase